MYKEFSDLPERWRERLVRVLGGDMVEKVHKPISGMSNRSIIETMNMEDGEERLNAFLEHAEMLRR